MQLEQLPQQVVGNISTLVTLQFCLQLSMEIIGNKRQQTGL